MPVFILMCFNTWAREEPNHRRMSDRATNAGFNTWAREEPNLSGTYRPSRQQASFNTWAREEPNLRQPDNHNGIQGFNTWAREEPNPRFGIARTT